MKFRYNKDFKPFYFDIPPGWQVHHSSDIPVWKQRLVNELVFELRKPGRNAVLLYPWMKMNYNPERGSYEIYVQS